MMKIIYLIDFYINNLLIHLGVYGEEYSFL